MSGGTYIAGGLSVFSPPGSSLSLSDSSLVAHYPISTLDVSNPIEFYINSSISDPFIDLNASYMYLKFHVTVNDKGMERGLVDDDNVGMCNNILQSIFGSVDFYLGETLLDSGTNNNNPYRGYFHNLLNFSQNDKLYTLPEEGFYKDTSKHFDTVAGDNKGGKSRKELLLNNNKVVLTGKPSIALFQSTRYLLPGVSARIRLTLSPTKFLFHCAEGISPLLHLDECKLYLRKITPSNNVRIAIEQQLALTKALYPVTESTIKSYNLILGSNNYSFDNILAGRLPRLLIMALV